MQVYGIDTVAMGCMTHSQDPQVSPPPPHSEPGPFMPVRTALILLASVVIGVVTGGLTLLCGTHPAGAVLAGLTSVGASVPVLHALIQ
jgi:hypothetical protein